MPDTYTFTFTRQQLQDWVDDIDKRGDRSCLVEIGALLVVRSRMIFEEEEA